MQTVGIKLAACVYQAHVGINVLANAPLLAEVQAEQAVIVTDAKVSDLYATKLQATLAQNGTAADIVAVPSGEGSKSWAGVQTLCDKFSELGLNRDGLVITVGGGVVGDLGGFSAGIYLRGVRYISVPTTLLAQVDASVGGKTGINIAAGKNLVGAFHHPQLVLADVTTLGSMPIREYRSGLAEIVKHGLLQSDIFEQVSANAKVLAQGSLGNEELLCDLIADNIRFKAQIVTNDVHETGVRAHLNLGHTFAHAIEAALGYGAMLHGEAVAIGLVAACRLSVHLGLAQAELTEKVASLLVQLGLPVKLPSFNRSALLQAMAQDKKIHAKRLRFVLLRELESVIIKSDVPPELVEQVLDEISQPA